MIKDYRIQITINYEPNLRNYPPSLATKRQAMGFDLDAVVNGDVGIEELLEGAEIEFSLVEFGVGD
ncbi:hypothetical protein P5W04_21205 [Mycobacteroides abscessus subsp. abscessus]|uniref:hypothetical protein n=1 Tax=Mycobacteroides abscessus TaxID=36809 RepID=UPI002658334E|nr:hypothetical protein [Mycobacteroides abscessus]MDO3076084.1 hypothetical protein [Mycobacteroides abscessus subsp. abscessus]MDO3242641.1 hypothetical protein [Mycobacteroides abscessus subsp. abscessus]WKE41512.1 hypothetical protein P3M62_11790 [Mycobacteroides abscessus subsp. abscessus]